MTEPVRILITNDDGIHSPGLLALARAARRFGEVRVVAPDVERSSTGHAITSSRPLAHKRTQLDDVEAYRVDGTPADCVALGVHLWRDVDLVLSGINLGLNLGTSIWHSGTLAGAKQAALLGLRGIALSAPADVPGDDAALAPWLSQVLDVLLAEPSLHLVNVNLPRAPRGMLWTSISVRHYDGRIVPTKDPLGRELYWFTVTPLETSDAGTDRWALERDWISLTPLGFDLTDAARLAAVRARTPLDERLAAAISPAEVDPATARAVRADEQSAPLETPASIATR